MFGLPLPLPPTIVTGPHAPSGVVPGEPMSPAAEAFDPRPSPTAENTHTPTLLAPSARHVVGIARRALGADRARERLVAVGEPVGERAAVEDVDLVVAAEVVPCCPRRS